jgi:hypothetical protein
VSQSLDVTLSVAVPRGSLNQKNARRPSSIRQSGEKIQSDFLPGGKRLVRATDNVARLEVNGKEARDGGVSEA